MEIRPITFREANRYVAEHHRHNASVVGCKFAIACYDDNQLCGVAICGRPVSRYLDDGKTLEINRVCTNGTKNACSMLYGASCRVAKEMGYKKVVTYTLESENGSSLKASNFIFCGKAGGTHWTSGRGKSRMPAELKNRWMRCFEDVRSRSRIEQDIRRVEKHERT